MNHWNIFGHDWAVEMLHGHVSHAALRHAYLISGPSGVGRRTLAVRLAQALNCQTPSAPGVACQTCRVCRQIEAGQNIDLMMIQAEREGGTLKVEQVREVQKFLSLKPYQSAYKIVIFLRFEEANPNAANALLKTLEEAPSYGLLLLTANNAEQLLPTIVSRCEILRLRPVSVEVTKSFLETRGLEPEKAHLLAHLSDGRPGYALRLAEDEKSLDFRAEKLDDLRRLLGASARERFGYAEKLAKDKEALRTSLFLWLSYWRDVLLRTAGAASTLTNIDRSEEIGGVAGQVSLAEARKTTQALENAIEKLEKNVNARLLTEVTLMNWPRLK
ncbi:MAG: DNA polymerase III subunit delta' [Anaerolineales bacterium]|jgi:DNA polymerase-3 subunit delta'|nr:DNA polymerase III subunit delta' [Anaerolineales bacterium]